MLQRRQLFLDQFLLRLSYLLKRLRVVLLPGHSLSLVFEPDLFFQLLLHLLALHGKSFLFDPLLVHVFLVLILDGFVPLRIGHSEIFALGLLPNLLVNIEDPCFLARCHTFGHTRRCALNRPRVVFADGCLMAFVAGLSSATGGGDQRTDLLVEFVEVSFRDAGLLLDDATDLLLQACVQVAFSGHSDAVAIAELVEEQFCQLFSGTGAGVGVAALPAVGGLLRVHG